MQTDMQNHKDKPGGALPEPAICNCLALRQAARHATQIYDKHLAAEGLKTMHSEFSRTRASLRRNTRSSPSCCGSARSRSARSPT